MGILLKLQDSMDIHCIPIDSVRTRTKWPLGNFCVRKKLFNGFRSPRRSPEMAVCTVGNRVMVDGWAKINPAPFSQKGSGKKTMSLSLKDLKGRDSLCIWARASADCAQWSPNRLLISLVSATIMLSQSPGTIQRPERRPQS